MQRPSDHQETERIYQIYDALRTLLLNKKYYAVRLSRFRSYNLYMEMVILGGAGGSGIAGLTIWHWPWGQFVWGVISASSVVAAAAKPLLKLTERIESYAKLYGEYSSTYVRMKILVDDLQVEKALSTQRIKSYDELRMRAADLSQLGDPTPNKKTVLKLQEEINAEITINTLWTPTSGESSNQENKLAHETPVFAEPQAQLAGTLGGEAAPSGGAVRPVRVKSNR
jgi:hypothetical protein